MVGFTKVWNLVLMDARTDPETPADGTANTEGSAAWGRSLRQWFSFAMVQGEKILIHEEEFCLWCAPLAPAGPVASSPA